MQNQRQSIDKHPFHIFETVDDKNDIINDSKENVMIYKKIFTVKKVPNPQFSTKGKEEAIFEKLKGKQINHLVHSYGIWKNNTHTHILMPYYKYNLADYLKNNWVRLGKNPHIVVSIVLQIIYGLVELGVAHRDLKLSNILIRDLDQDQVQVVLADFQSCNQQGEILNKSILGTQMYMAPQMKLYNSKPYNNKIDIWSLALVICQLCAVFQSQQYLTKFPQFPEQFQALLLRRSFNKRQYLEFLEFMEENRPIISKYVPDLLRHIIFKSLVFKQQKRISLQQILIYFHDNLHKLKEHFPRNKQQAVQKQFKKYSKMYKTMPNQEQQIKKLKQLFSLYQKLKCHQNLNTTKANYRGIKLLTYCLIQTILKKFQELVKRKVVKQDTLAAFLLTNQLKGDKNIINIDIQKFELKTILFSKYNDNDIEQKYQQFRRQPQKLFKQNITIYEYLREFLQQQSKIDRFVKLVKE